MLFKASKAYHDLDIFLNFSFRKTEIASSEQRHLNAEYRYTKSVNPKVLSCMCRLIYMGTIKLTMGFRAYIKHYRGLSTQFWSNLPWKWHPKNSQQAFIPPTYKYRARPWRPSDLTSLYSALTWWSSENHGGHEPGAKDQNPYTLLLGHFLPCMCRFVVWELGKSRPDFTF